MNNSPLDKKIEEMAAQSVSRYNDDDGLVLYRVRKVGQLSYIQGAKAALALPEVQELVSALKTVRSFLPASDMKWIVADEAIENWVKFTSKEGE